jgi:hypothetical protein
MKKKIMSFLSALVCALVLFFVFYLQAKAQEDTEEEYRPQEVNTESQAMLTQGLLVNNAKVESQEGSKINLVFDLHGGQLGQAGIMFSVDLMKKEKVDGKDVAYSLDHQVFDQKSYARPGKILRKRITYEAPAFLSGSYGIYLEFRNDKGKIYNMVSAGDVTLTGSGEYVEMIPSSCHLTVQNEASGKKYEVYEGVDVAKEENLNAVCDVQNKFTKSITITPNFETFYRTTFGEKISENKQTALILGPGEKKTVTLAIPKAQKPQAYDAVLTFQDEKGTAISNDTTFHYIIRGASATVQNLKTDKQNYVSGDTAKVSIAWTGSADIFVGSRKAEGTKSDGAILDLQIIGNDGKNCAEKFSQSINVDEEEDQLFSVPITKDCNEPTLQISIKDKKGALLDQAIYFLGNGKGAVIPIAPEGPKDKIKSLLKTILILISILALGIIIYMLVKKKNANLIRIIVLLVIIGGLAGFIITKAMAKKACTDPKKCSVNNQKLPPKPTPEELYEYYVEPIIDPPQQAPCK